MTSREQLNIIKRGAVEILLEKELQEKGHIFIHKDSGLFEAIK